MRAALLGLCAISAALTSGVAHAAPDPLSPAAARWTSAGVTLGGVGLMGLGGAADASPLILLGAGGLLVGPSAGHFRAGEWGRGVLSSSLRTASLGYGAVSLGTQPYCLQVREWEDQGWNDRGPCRKTSLELVAAWSSLGLWAGLTGYDLWDAGRAPERVRARRARRGVAQLRLEPSLDLGGEGARGLALRGRW